MAARLRRLTKTRKWRRISMKTLETDSEMAGPAPGLTRGITMRFLSWRPGLGVTAKQNLALKPLRSYARSPKTGDRSGRSDLKERIQGPDSPLVGAEVVFSAPTSHSFCKRKGGLAARLATALAGLTMAAGPVFAETPPLCGGKDLSHVPGLAEAEARRADDLLNADGLLWRVDKGALRPSYLFGTIHSTDDDALATVRRAVKAIPDAKVVVTELGGPIDAMEKAKIGAEMLARALDHDHDTFVEVPAEDRADIEKMLGERGYPIKFLHHLKLWFLAILTAAPECEAKREALDLPEVDQSLAERAKAAGVKVVALETPQEQLDTVASIKPEVAAALLAVAAREPAMTDDIYATLLKLYRESRPAEILAVGDAVDGISASERAAEDAFTRLLLVERNAIMAERLTPLLKDGGVFVAVGALHLIGKDGLVERLRGLGYTVTKVW